MPTVANAVGRQRAAAGLRQQELAARVGISRQSLSQLEAGRSVPSTEIALRLARALGCRVEDLFWVDGGRAPISVEMAEDATRPADDARVILASIDGRWVAHRLGPDEHSFAFAADGLVSGRPKRGLARVTPLDDVRGARDTLLCAGCAPAFAILAARANTHRGDRVVWLERSSGDALDLLARGQVHVAGAHLYDEASREFNVPFVERRLPGRPMLVFNLARWEAGLVVARGNPRRVRGVRDLVRRGVSFVRRQPGAAAQALVERLLRREGLSATAVSGAHLVAHGHMEVARLVAGGAADCGVALPAVARAHGLDFIPLAEERFDLIVAKDLARDERVVRLLDTLTGRGFRREIESLGGHIIRDAGRLIADTTPHA
jgi:molybdate-binding protein/DNA-binding XRE family transcriptional regulator